MASRFDPSQRFFFFFLNRWKNIGFLIKIGKVASLCMDKQ